MIKSKTESPTTRLKTLLLKLSEYTTDLSRLHNIADTPDNKDVIPLIFFTTSYTQLYQTCIFTFS